MRVSVSAEAYGTFNKKQSYKEKVIPKSNEVKERIKKRLLEAFMFSALDDFQRDIVINAMEERIFKVGEKAI